MYVEVKKKEIKTSNEKMIRNKRITDEKWQINIQKLKEKLLTHFIQRSLLNHSTQCNFLGS